MVKDMIKEEKDLLNTLVTLKNLIKDNDVFVMSGMIKPLDKHIEKSNYLINELYKVLSK